MANKIIEKSKNHLQSVIKGCYRAVRPASSEKSILVAGVQRSGTNMVMDILDNCISTDVYHEIDSRAFDNYQMKSLPEILELKNNSSSYYFVIKTLCELQRIESIITALDDVRVVWVYRHYHDVVNSMLVSFNNQASQVNRIVKYRNSDGWLSEFMTDQTYEVLCKHAKNRDLNDASAAALQWYFRNVIFFEKHLYKDDRVYLLKYENLVRNPENEIKRLYRFTGIEEEFAFKKKIYSSSIRKSKPVELDEDIERLCSGLYEQLEFYADPKK
ncbi:sulfotransferase [Aestuariirhabdus sp. Z084]|uniref:sulfotransferase family protein n=1 Tax=Aestuariirhabdus haliotis TaxID=2918751 RepID=UPI00201B3D6F|nr:sulfotransferase [Aestuariirhabdus haliotis]MCL6414688.1 sulfotransferase [Aestuariirhabdus haliotis]MCL6418620.1 sulfotransferase [Aestuariirhabdus haliotis]